MTDRDPLAEYRKKRNFETSREPFGPEHTEERPESRSVRELSPIFVIQKHAASRLHYDFRLEVGGVLKSWAVPKGPSLDPVEKRLAVSTEDHPLEYANFEGVIPRGQYGGGTVMIWDHGTYENLRWDKTRDPASMEQALREGRLEFRLDGRKLKGTFAMVRTRMGGKENWLLIKKDDATARPGSDVTKSRPNSVVTGRSLKEIAEDSNP